MYKSDWLNLEESNGKAVINITGVIGGDFFFDEGENNTSEAMREELRAIEAIDANEIDVFIDSPGGSVNHALSIYGLLSNHKANVTTTMEGMTASAATVIAQAGDVRRVADNGLYLIHEVRTFLAGSLSGLKSDVANAEKVNEKTAHIYATRSGSSIEDVKAIMSEANGDGMWRDSSEMIELGFADEVHKSLKMAAQVDEKLFNKIGLTIPKMENKEKSTLDKVLDKLGILSNKVEETSEVPTLKNQISELTNECDELRNQVNTLQVDAGKVEELTNAHNEVVSAKDTEIENLTNEINELKAKLNIQEAKAIDPKAEKIELGEVKDTPEVAAVKEMINKASEFDKRRYENG